MSEDNKRRKAIVDKFKTVYALADRIIELENEKSSKTDYDLIAEYLEDVFEEQEFFDLMQTYRHASVYDQAATVAAYDAVKSYILQSLKEPA